MASNGTLTPKQHQAIAALLTERNTRDAAKAANVAYRTLWRWLSDPVFRGELTKHEGAAIDQATRSLLAMQDAALGVFDTVLKDSKAKDGDRLRAAEAVLDYLLKLRELNNLEARISALEAMQNGQS